MTALLATQALTAHYGRIQALRGIDLEVRQGELVALVGANGAGKTTLLKTLSGVVPASGGTVHFAGSDITRAAPNRRVRLGIAQVPEGRQVWGPLSVEDNLRLGGVTRPSDERARRLGEIYAMFPVLDERSAEAAGALSGGQQQMLAIGRALMASPRLLLLDEPSMGLAPLLVKDIFAVIRRLRNAGTTVLLVEQNARAALRIADRAYVMETGRLVMGGTGAELLGDDRLRATYLGTE
jgi:branched-chain amino acid transport system ATP-binding protein